MCEILLVVCVINFTPNSYKYKEVVDSLECRKTQSDTPFYLYHQVNLPALHFLPTLLIIHSNINNNSNTKYGKTINDLANNKNIDFTMLLALAFYLVLLQHESKQLPSTLPPLVHICFAFL